MGIVVTNVHGDGMKKDVCLLPTRTLARYCTSARPFRLPGALSSSSSSSPFGDRSPSFFVATVVLATFAVVRVFLPFRRFVVGRSPLATSDFAGALFTASTGVVASPAGSAGATALTFEAIHAEEKRNRSYLPSTLDAKKANSAHAHANMDNGEHECVTYHHYGKDSTDYSHDDHHLIIARRENVG